VTDLVLIAAGTALTSIAAQLTIPLWPVPITGQTFAVLLVGFTLGAVRGALSMVLYLILGVAGLPIFAAGGHGTQPVAVGDLGQHTSRADRRRRRVFSTRVPVHRIDDVIHLSADKPVRPGGAV